MTSTAIENALVINGVDKTFGATDRPAVLQDVSLQLARGEFLAVVGPSGCGKTTLLRIIQGLETATSGTVELPSTTGAAPRLSYVFQRSSLLPWFSVRKNVAFGISLKAGRDVHGSKVARDRAVDELLELTGLSPYADYLPNQISGGMQQRVNVARALAVRPDVLLLDEPFSALDALTRERLQVDICAILENLGTTAVLVTHDIREAVFMADRVAIMSAHPGTVRQIVEIDEPRPRTVAFQHSPELAEVERSIWRRLHPTV
ncbi:ABC transporter ATP-binding protein [Actinomycetospora termitidis]|uniref:ABC transporter ATP-binding protein n=1 Tax=Actinomycetospora termitidis TaxID=3053470 RepID=A0ABT7MJY6_9PSEU|nr:ABC transporter ATP-binding protein [Actinomycetospora sp. Odt1-22]MDL5159673.1 ABC transporter ATP-binding protein [Actinomycetospora sp. Odt1-22]